MPAEKPPDFGFEPTSCRPGTTRPKVFIRPRIWLEIRSKTRRGVFGPQPMCGQHAVVALHANLAIKAALGQVGQTVGIISIGLVRSRVGRETFRLWSQPPGRVPLGDTDSREPKSSRNRNGFLHGSAEPTPCMTGLALPLAPRIKMV